MLREVQGTSITNAPGSTRGLREIPSHSILQASLSMYHVLNVLYPGHHLQQLKAGRFISLPA